MPTSLTRFSTRHGSTVDDRLDGLGRLDRQTRPTGSGNWSYLGEMAKERTISAGAGSVRTRLERDALGQVLRESTVGATAATFEFDFLRDEAGRTGSLVKRIGLPSGVETSWRGFTYDTQGRLSELHEAPAAPSITVGSGSATDVRALSANVGAGVWAYAREPKVGSTVSITGPGPARLGAATRGAGYQLSSYSVAGGATRGLTYDTAGRVATHAGVTHSWDDFSMLTRVSGGGVEESLQYDGVGRLVARYDAVGLVEEYVLDGEQMVAALDKSGAQMWSAFWGQVVDNLVTMVRGGVEYTAVTDGRGSIGAWYHSGSATLAATAEYTPEGRAQTRVVQGGATCDEVGNTSTCPAPLGLPFGFHGAFKSPGTGLLYFRNRWYSAVSGEWLSQDPLGPVDSHNLYAFNGFDAVNFIDSFGLGRIGFAVVPDPDSSIGLGIDMSTSPTTGRNAANGGDVSESGPKQHAQGRPERPDETSSGGGASNSPSPNPTPRGHVTRLPEGPGPLHPIGKILKHTTAGVLGAALGLMCSMTPCKGVGTTNALGETEVTFNIGVTVGGIAGMAVGAVETFVGMSAVVGAGPALLKGGPAAAASSAAAGLTLVGVGVLTISKGQAVAAQGAHNAAMAAAKPGAATPTPPSPGPATPTTPPKAAPPVATPQAKPPPVTPKVTSANKMQSEVLRGQAPTGVTRVDKALVPNEKPHVHFGKGEQSNALNFDGTWKHGEQTLTNAQQEWLLGHGWTLPK